MEKQRIIYLLSRYRADEISEQELTELRLLLKNEEHKEMFSESIQDDMMQLEPGEFDKNKWQLLLVEIFYLEKAKPQSTKIISLYRKTNRWNWKRFAVAAAVLIVIGAGGWFALFNKATNEKVQSSAAVNDVKAPESNRAMITMANGQKIFLDSATDGTLVQLKGVEVIKLADGQISYQASSNSTGTSEQVEFNTLTNPRGSRVIDLQLSDGSRIWLNAGSSVTYPVAFVGNERRVIIEGEAYFEVTNNKLKPFIVSKTTIDVEVLGTSFNIKAYEEDNEIKVTLLNGKVKVTARYQTTTGSSEVLVPGQQAIFHRSGELTVMDNTDLEQVIAWKNGFFSFQSADIPTVMRELSRWYDVEVKYTGKIPKRQFEGAIDRNLSLSKVLSILERMNVHFRIDENRNIIILP
jgi:transmembrane sensor